jgi:ATP-binding cassette subfamily B protein/subfamily B ATP-binding cassette protein MsbA
LIPSAPSQPRPRRRLLQTLRSQEPADQLLRQTARQQWRLIAISIGSSVVVAFSEVATLGLVFLAVEVLSAPVGQSFNWASTRLQGWWPAAAAWLNGVPPLVQFLGLLGLALLVQALISLASFLNQVCIGYFSARCKALVTARIHSQVLQLSFPCASGYKVGDLTDYAAQGPEAIRIQVEQSSALVVGLLMMAAYLATMVSISPWLLLAVLVIGLLITLLQKRFLPRIRSGSKSVADTQVAISSRITEDFQGLRLLHSSGLLEMADRRLLAVMGELEGQLRGQARRLAVVGPFSSFLPILAITLLAAVSVLLLDGRSTGVLPSLVTFVLALQKLSGRINIFSINFNTLADNSGRYKRLNAILSPQGKQFRRLGGAPISALQQAIRFDGVSLQYAPELPPALREISFTLAKGQMLALVGPSGAGKSSIADLLTGLYAPTQGRILIDGTPIEQLDLASWQQRLGVVSQDTFLFNATIAENIAIGFPGATQAQIEAACMAAQAAGFIECLPNGYNTLVGERGFRLSGGQRQRLSLARAILREPELLILDEATSALDSQSERLVQEAIEAFECNHTVLVIAHRLSTIVRADQILVLEHGRVVQRGTHSSLLAEGGIYNRLWEIQRSQQQQINK